MNASIDSGEIRISRINAVTLDSINNRGSSMSFYLTLMGFTKINLGIWNLQEGVEKYII